jgi:N6-adenosine-specific RNA methylase IME4
MTERFRLSNRRGPYLELFARRERPGWTTWGDEIAPPSESEGAQ